MKSALIAPRKSRPSKNARPSRSGDPKGTSRPPIPSKAPTQGRSSERPVGRAQESSPLWTWWLDESITSFVKRSYSPKEKWKDRPFSREDAAFFYKGVEELSDLFTQDRPKTLPDYFAHPRFRSAYFLYFLPR